MGSRQGIEFKVHVNRESISTISCQKVVIFAISSLHLVDKDYNSGHPMVILSIDGKFVKKSLVNTPYSKILKNTWNTATFGTFEN